MCFGPCCPFWQQLEKMAPAPAYDGSAPGHNVHGHGQIGHLYSKNSHNASFIACYRGRTCACVLHSPLCPWPRGGCFTGVQTVELIWSHILYILIQQYDPRVYRVGLSPLGFPGSEELGGWVNKGVLCPAHGWPVWGAILMLADGSSGI